jgi:hypothetical protein
MNNVKQFKKYYHGMSVTPTLPIVVNNIIYLLCEKLGCFENKKTPIVIYDSMMFDES